MKLADSATVLAFDVGSRWVGIALGNVLTQAPRSLCTLDRERGDFWPKLDAVLKEWKPAALVVGDPLQPDRLGSASSSRIRKRQRVGMTRN